MTLVTGCAACNKYRLPQRPPTWVLTFIMRSEIPLCPFWYSHQAHIFSQSQFIASELIISQKWRREKKVVRMKINTLQMYTHVLCVVRPPYGVFNSVTNKIHHPLFYLPAWFMASTTRDKIHLDSLCGDRRREFNTLAHARNGAPQLGFLAPRAAKAFKYFCMRTSPQQRKLFLSFEWCGCKVQK
jgi:hypothetical protein